METFRFLVMEQVPFALVTLSRALAGPSAVNVWLGFCTVSVAPSLNVQNQEIGLLRALPENWTGVFAGGFEGVYVNDG